MDPHVGLCSVCRHVRTAGNRRGSVFYLCRKADEDPRLRRYPPLPVVRCAAFEPEESSRNASRPASDSDGFSSTT